MSNTDTSTFDIRKFTDKLEPTKEKNKYVCPCCGGDNLSINPETGAYHCWNGCECKDIREAVSPWKEVLEQRKNNKVGNTMNRIATAAPKAEKQQLSPVEIPGGKLAIARLGEIPTDIPQPVKAQVVKNIRQSLEAKGCTSEEIKQTTVITYDHGDGHMVYRYQAPNSKNPKGYEKTFAVSHTNGSGQTVYKKGSAPWKAYRQNEAIASGLAVEDGCVPVILVHEGQKCVDAGRAEKLAGITAQGNPTENDWLMILNDFTLEMNGRKFVLAYCADNDDTGAKKASVLVKAASRLNKPVVTIDLKAIFPDLCEKGDVADILESGMTGDELAKLILEEIYQIQCEQNNVEADEDEFEEFGDNLTPNQEFNQKALNFLFGGKHWICADNLLHQWVENHYEPVPDCIMRPMIASFCNSYVVPDSGGKIRYPYAKPAKVEELLKWVKMRFEIDPTRLNPPGINCTNGVVQVNWESGKPVVFLEEHDPNKHFFNYEPKVKYDSEADSKFCDQLLECLDDSRQQVLLRNLGASIDLDEVRKRRGREVKILLACGLGSNGKDALRQTVSTIFGHQAITSVSLADFAHYDDGRKFALAPLLYSRVNWASENPQTARLDKIQSLKLFATGNKLHSEKKGKDHIEFEPHAIGIFNLNDVPSLQGTIQAIQDRIAPIEFRKTYKINPDPNNPDELQADPRFAYDQLFVQQMVAPAFLNKMIQGLIDLMAEGIDYDCTVDSFKTMQKENNHLFQFCEDVGLGYVPNGSMTAMEIWEKLEVWYQDNGTLTIECDGRKAWNDQVRPSDKNVKAINQVIARFKQIFSKATLATTAHGSGKKMIQTLKGIGIITPSNEPFSIVDNRTPISNFSTPVPPQSPPQQILINQDIHPTHPNFSNDEKNQTEKFEVNELLTQSDQKSVEEKDKLGWVGCDDLIPTVSEISTGVETGVADDLIAVEPSTIENESVPPEIEDAQALREALSTEYPFDVLYKLLSNWTIERKAAAREHLSQDEVNAVRSYANRPIKPLTFTFNVGDRIKCYPTQMHADNQMEVTATVMDVETERGWFKGCTVEFGGQTVRIAGGGADWVLRKI